MLVAHVSVGMNRHKVRRCQDILWPFFSALLTGWVHGTPGRVTCQNPEPDNAINEVTMQGKNSP